MDDVHAHNADMRNTVMRYMRSVKSDFSKSMMQSADASFATFTDSIFQEAQLQYSSFVEATLERANMQLADARGADFRGTDMRCADTTGITIDSTTDLRGADLSGAIGADELRKLKAKQEDTFLSKILRTSLKNMLIGSAFLAVMYVLPCLALGYDISLYGLYLAAETGAFFGLCAAPYYIGMKTLTQGFDAIKEINFSNVKDACRATLVSLGTELSAKITHTLFTPPTDAEHAELAGSDYLKGIATALKSARNKEKTVETTSETMQHNSQNFVDKFQQHKGTFAAEMASQVNSANAINIAAGG
jgi:uncharacterized protein YjbI with pentapeptide repeats